MSEQKRIKTKILKVDKSKWWGDDFDVRFFLISQLKKIRNKKILDIGGGIGIISSEIHESNFRVNIDTNFEDLLTCKNKMDEKIHLVCGSMSSLPFRNNIFDDVICSNLLEVGKSNDILKKRIIKGLGNYYPSVMTALSEIFNITNSPGTIFITTPNNVYYKSNKLTFQELNFSLSKYFKKFKINFFNVYKKFGEYRKFNLANIIPKLNAKIQNPDKIISNLIKTESSNNYSVSFYVEVKK